MGSCFVKERKPLYSLTKPQTGEKIQMIGKPKMRGLIEVGKRPQQTTTGRKRGWGKR